MVLSEKSDIPFSILVLPENLKNRIQRIIHEYWQQTKLKKHGLSNRRKILLSGPPGTGKTLTARVLAHELQLPLHTIKVDKLVTKFMGETSAKLRQIFNLISEVKGVYLFDEFDAIGGDRSLDNDVGEMRRVLNIELDASDSIIIGATNNPSLLDRALFRRFDDVIHSWPTNIIHTYFFPVLQIQEAIIAILDAVAMPPPRIMPQDRQPHAEHVRRSLENAWHTAADRQAVAHSDRRGVYLEFVSEPGFDLILKSLESRQADIKLLNVKKEGEEGSQLTRATIFVPLNKSAHFLKKATEYAEKDNPPKKDGTTTPKNAPLIESIGDVRAAILESSFWQDFISRLSLTAHEAS